MHQQRRGDESSERKGRSVARRLGAAALALLAVTVLASSAEAALSVTGPLSPQNGFPAWYEDANGTQLQLCIADPGCPVSPPVADFVAPDGEAFYSLVGADLSGPAGQSVTMELAIEAAFLDTAVTFGRVQVTMAGMKPNSDYTFTYPYGTAVWTTDANGGMVGGFRAAARHEVGCFAGFAAPCDITLGTEIGPFLTWDPAESLPPAGYIGNGLTPHTVVGATNNFVRVTGPGLPLGGIQTSEFTVEGKLASAPTPIFFVAPASGDFGTQRVASSTTRTVTVKNNGLAAMTAFTGASVQGADAASFAAGADTCTGVALASGQTCTVDVTFTPGRTGDLSASLVLATGAGAGESVALAGVGGVPGVTADPGVVSFFNQPVGTTSPELPVTLRNTGPVALHISTASITGDNAAEFGLASNTCAAAVAPGRTCTIGLRFLPGANGTRNASLVLEHDGDGSPHVVPLTGAGTGASTGTAPSPVAAPPARLVVSEFRMAHRVPRTRSAARGITVAMRLQRGTRVLRFRVYRKAGSARKLIWSGTRTPRASSAYRVRLGDRTLRRALKPGNYEVEVRAGTSAATLGAPSGIAFTVLRARR